MALHATIIVPDGTTDEQLEKARQVAILAIEYSMLDFDSSACDPLSLDRDYWQQRFEESKAALALLRAAGYTSLIP